MSRRIAAVVQSVCAVALLLASCSDGESEGSGGDGDSAVTVPADDSDLLEPLADDVDLEPMQAYLDEEGRLTFEGAKALFSAVFTPLPGVEPAPDADIHEATTIFMVLWAHHEELTPEQQQVFESVALAGDDEAVEVEPGFGERRRSPPPVPDAVKQAVSRSAAESVNYYSDVLGRRLPFPVRTVVLPGSVGAVRLFGDHTLADAQLLSDGGTDYCKIRVNYDKYQPGDLEFVMAHEVFHCYQFAITGGEVVANWVMEGTAEWAAEDKTGGNSQVAEGWSDEWAATPTRPISRRTYDAVGLYALTTELNVPMYRYVDDLLRTPRIATVRDAVGERLDIEWALSYAGREGWGGKYALTAGSFTGQGARRQIVRATVDGGPALFPSPAGSRDSGAQVYSLAADGDVLVISGNGYGGIRFEGADEAEFNGSFIGDFCLKPGGCVCPDGSTTGGGGREITGRGSRAVFIGWGPQGDATPTLEVQSLAQWCNSEPVPESTNPATSGCAVGLWQTTRMNIPAVNDLPPIVGGEGMTVEFGSDGTFIANYDTMVPIVAVLDDKNGVVFEFRFTGVVPGTWSLDENGRMSGSGDLSTMRAVGRIIEPFEQEVLNMPIAALGGAGSAPGVYTVAECSGRTLKLTTLYGGGKVSMELQRL